MSLAPVLVLGGAFLVMACAVLVWAIPPRDAPANDQPDPDQTLAASQPALAPDREEQPTPPQPTRAESPPTALATPGQDRSAQPEELLPPAELPPEIPPLAPPAPVQPPAGGERAVPAAVQAKPTFKRLDVCSEDDHLTALAELPEVGLAGQGQRLLAVWDEAIRNLPESSPVPNLTSPGPIFTIKSDLRQLPFQMGAGCQLSGPAAKNLGELSKK
jgi:hypothetical protein